MPDQDSELLSAVREIRDLIRLMAEPVIAQRDEKLRISIKQIVGKSAVKAKAVHLMDGSRTQAQIRKSMKIDAADLSKLVKALRELDLVDVGDKPKINIPVPVNFFELKGEN